MKSFRKVLLIITVIALLCVLVACGENTGTGSTHGQGEQGSQGGEQGGGQGGQEQGGSEVKPLDTPYLVLDGNVAYWKPIDNAYGYEIELNGEVRGIVDETSFELQAGESLRIRAISGDPDKYKDSAFSNTVRIEKESKQKLDAPVIKVDYTDGKHVTFEPVENATSYLYELNGEFDWLSATSENRIGSFEFGTVVRVLARDDNGFYADSEYSNAVTLGAMSDCTQVTDLSEYVGTYMTFDTDRYVVVGEDNKVTVYFSPNTDIDDAKEVKIFVKQDGEDTTVIAKFDNSTKIITKKQGSQVAFSFMNDTYYKLVAGNNFGDSEDVYGIYCNYDYERPDEYYFSELTQTAIVADGVSYNLYKFVDTIEDFNATFYYDNGKYVDLNFQKGLGGNDPDRFRFNERAYNIIKQATEIPNEIYVQSKDDYRLLLGEGDIIFLTYVLQDGKVYFNLDLGTGTPVRKSLWVMGKDGYFSPTDENDFTTLKRVNVGEEQVSFGDSLYFNEIYESKLYNYFHTPSNNFVSADFVSTKLTSMITVDRYGQFLTKFGSNPTKTDFKVFDGRNGYTLLQINGKYYRFSFEHNEENNYRTEGIRITVNSSSGDSVERYCLMEDESFDFNGTYRNNDDSVVLTKDGKLTYNNFEYQVVTIDGKKYARNASIFKRISKADENEFQFVSDALYTTSDLIEATIDEVLGDLEKDISYQLMLLGDRVNTYEFEIYDDKAYYNNLSATLYKDGSGKLTAIENRNGTYPASIVTKENGEATIVIDGYEYYKPKTAKIPDEYIGKRFYTFKYEDDKTCAQDTLYFERVDGKTYVFVLNDTNKVHPRVNGRYQMIEDYDYFNERYFINESALELIGDVYRIIPYSGYPSDISPFKFLDDGSIMYGNVHYYEVKKATIVPVEYQGSYYDSERRIIEIIDNSAVKTETSRAELLSDAQTLSKVYYIENERGAKLYLKDFYPSVRFSETNRELYVHAVRQLVGTNIFKLQETPEWLGNAFIKKGTYYTRFFNDKYEGLTPNFYNGHQHIDYFAFTFRAYNDVTYVRNAGGYVTEYNDTIRFTGSSNGNSTPLISQNNVKNRCYYYDDGINYWFVYQFATEAIRIWFDKESLGPYNEKIARFNLQERVLVDTTESNKSIYESILSYEDAELKYVSIVEPTELPDGMLGNFEMKLVYPIGTEGVSLRDLHDFQRVYKTSDGKYKFQQLSYCVTGDVFPTSFMFFDYDVMYDEATGRYLYGHNRTWTENTALKIDAATDFEPVGELIYDNGTLTVRSFNALKSRKHTDYYLTYYVVTNDSTYEKVVASDVDFASFDMVGKTYFGIEDPTSDGVRTIVKVVGANTVSMIFNLRLDFFDAKLFITQTVENATDNSVNYKGYLISTGDDISAIAPIMIEKSASGEFKFIFNHDEKNHWMNEFIMSEVHESNVIKGVKGVLLFKSYGFNNYRDDTATFDADNNTLTLYVAENFDSENMQTYVVTTFYYNADETMMYCFAGGRIFYFAYEADGTISTDLQKQYVICADGTEIESFEFFVPKEETEGGETSGEQTGEGETSGETNA